MGQNWSQIAEDIKKLHAVATRDDKLYEELEIGGGPKDLAPLMSCPSDEPFPLAA